MTIRRVGLGLCLSIGIFLSALLQTNAFSLLTWAFLQHPLVILVNRDHPVPENWSADLAEIENGYRVDRRIQADLEKMLADMRAEGLYPWICSGYRTEEEQRTLYALEVDEFRATGLSEQEAGEAAAKWVAVPGTSEHQLGLAVDILDETWMRMEESQENTPVQQWLMTHCAEYGFILRYPVDKSEITGIGYEPWHYRYVGKPLAQAITDSGLCLEEYLGQIKERWLP